MLLVAEATDAAVVRERDWVCAVRTVCGWMEEGRGSGSGPHWSKRREGDRERRTCADCSTSQRAQVLTVPVTSDAQREADEVKSESVVASVVGWCSGVVLGGGGGAWSG